MVYVHLNKNVFEFVRNLGLEQNKKTARLVNDALIDYFKIKKEPEKVPRRSIRKQSLCQNRYSKTYYKILITNEALTKLEKIKKEEYSNSDEIICDLINGYEIQPVKQQEHTIRSILMSSIQRMKRLDPFAYFYGIDKGIALRHYNDAIKDYKNNIISWEIYSQSYIERLKEPDAQKKIAEIIKHSASTNIYITSFERDEEYSLRNVCAKFINGIRNGEIII